MRLIVCRKHNSLGVSMKTETQQTNTSMLGCFACLTANTPYCQQKCIVSPSFSFYLPALFSFRAALSPTLLTTNERHRGVRSGLGMFLPVPFKTLVRFRKSRAEERRWQILCDKRDNNFHLSLTKNRLYLHHVCHKEAFCRPLLSAVVFSSLCRNMS